MVACPKRKRQHDPSVNRCQDLRDIDQVSMRLAEGRYLGRGEVLPTSLAEIALPTAVSVAVLTKSFCLLSRSLGKSHWERPFLFFQWLLNPLFGSFSIASHVQLPHASTAFRETTQSHRSGIEGGGSHLTAFPTIAASAIAPK